MSKFPEAERKNRSLSARRASSERRRQASRFEGELDQHEPALVALIEELRETGSDEPKAWQRISRRHGRGDGPFSKSDVLLAWRALRQRCGWDEDEREFVARLRTKPVRTGSGVTPVTVLTRPHPCPGTCTFCPSDVRMPKSYLAMEPGAQRAAQLAFDPYIQTWNRLRAYHNNGHLLDKIELIILGGTFTAYPRAYQIWFVKRCFDALNEFAADAQDPAVPANRWDEVTDTAAAGRYNALIGARLAGDDLDLDAEQAGLDALRDAHARNESATARCVGLSVETRPDALGTIEDVVAIRELGATKVQLGYQSLDDAVLQQSRRGHDVAATRHATALLREAGFKVQAHWMPNLPGSTPDMDIADYQRMFADPDFRPDELKLYPCCLLPDSELVAEHRAGRWQPYPPDELLRVMSAALASTPESCRITRVIRDIPSDDILAGNRTNNLREVIEAELGSKGIPLREIRSRQIHRPLDEEEDLQFRCHGYRVSTGSERFLQVVTARDELIGFLRLSLPSSPSRIAELGGSAVIREVHVYGATQGFRMADQGAAQHAGVGARLLREAERIAREAGYTDLAVISAVGTRAYYHKHGFENGLLYQHRRLSRPESKNGLTPGPAAS